MALTEQQQKMYNFWIDKPVPYCCRDCVPEEFQHENQLYDKDMTGKPCPRQQKYKEILKALRNNQQPPKYELELYELVRANKIQETPNGYKLA